MTIILTAIGTIVLVGVFIRQCPDLAAKVIARVQK